MSAQGIRALLYVIELDATLALLGWLLWRGL